MVETSQSPLIRTKIIATIGPASSSEQMLGRLIDAGVDVFRLNFSHGTVDEHGRTLQRIETVCRAKGAMVAVMGDLCGPKIRVDPVEGDAFDLATGKRIELVADHVIGTAQRISTSRPDLITELKVGDRVLIDDGNVRLRAAEKHADRVVCLCEAGGTISTHKGVNAPDTAMQMSALTPKDREDLTWALDRRLDYIAMSFVRSATDLRELRELVPIRHGDCRVVAKIETVLATQHLDEIIESADAVLVARGDLGVEMDLAQVPLVQKRIARRCLVAGKPVIVATQMLQSMVASPTATRAEVSDVANAIFDSADCVMLSAETSVGKYPVESVEMMARIAQETETFIGAAATERLDVTATLRPVATAVAHGAAVVAKELSARAVAVWTQTGNTARLLSKCRLTAPVVGLSPDESVCRRMCLYYGVIPIRLNRQDHITAMLRDVDEALLTRQLVERGDLVVVVAGTHLRQVGSTNALLIHLVGDTSDAMPEITG